MSPMHRRQRRCIGHALAMRSDLPTPSARTRPGRPLQEDEEEDEAEVEERKVGALMSLSCYGRHGCHIVAVPGPSSRMPTTTTTTMSNVTTT
eukprot:1272509-Pyramimonas_sp.AAC.1